MPASSVTQTKKYSVISLDIAVKWTWKATDVATDNPSRKPIKLTNRGMEYNTA